MDSFSLERMSRDDLVAKARALGVERPELMTRVELGDEIVRRSQTDPTAQQKARGWLGVARDLVASVVESGLNLPDAAALIRGERAEFEPPGPGPVATVTLAEIYAAQGHVERARAMLDQVLAREPDHPAASALHERLLAQGARRSAEAPPRSAASEAPPASVEPVTERPSPAPFAAPAPIDLTPPPSGVAELERAAPAEAVAVERPAPAAEVPAAEAVGERAPLEVRAAVTMGPPPGAQAPSSAPHAVPEAALLLLRGNGPHPILCWDLSAEESAFGEPNLELECVGFVAKQASAERHEVSYPVTARRGRVVLSDFDARAVVRAALGYHRDESFVPIAIASEMRVRGDSLDVRFRPPHLDVIGPTPLECGLAREFA